MAESGRLRQRQLTLRLFDEEYELLDMKAKSAGISKSDYLRNMILFGTSQKQTTFSDEAADRLILEISRIGTNINQIARYVNMQKSIDGVDVQNLINEFGDLQSALIGVCLE